MCGNVYKHRQFPFIPVLTPGLHCTDDLTENLDQFYISCTGVVLYSSIDGMTWIWIWCGMDMDMTGSWERCWIRETSMHAQAHTSVKKKNPFWSRYAYNWTRQYADCMIDPYCSPTVSSHFQSPSRPRSDHLPRPTTCPGTFLLCEMFEWVR